MLLRLCDSEPKAAITTRRHQRVRPASWCRAFAVRTENADRTTMKPGAKPMNDTPEGWVELLDGDNICDGPGTVVILFPGCAFAVRTGNADRTAMQPGAKPMNDTNDNADVSHLHSLCGSRKTGLNVLPGWR